MSWKCSPTIKPVSGTIPLIAEKTTLFSNEMVKFSNSFVKKADGIAKIKTSYEATILLISEDKSNCCAKISAACK